MIRRLLPALALLLAPALAACPNDFEVEGRKFPCRGPEDCVEGFVCDGTRYVCVPSEGGSDAGASDRGLAGQGLGVACGRGSPCAVGACVDGVCCERACDEPCHRCDLEPGRCLPAADGTDPDGDCDEARYRCADFTFGLVERSCYAGVSEEVTRGTCGPLGQCRPRGCRDRGPGLEISRCESETCMRPDACPYGAPVARFDEPSELCASGEAAACALSSGSEGCCSLLGACCPAPSCGPDQGACE